jgi:hypothetical protein
MCEDQAVKQHIISTAHASHLHCKHALNHDTKEVLKLFFLFFILTSAAEVASHTKKATQQKDLLP